MKPLIGVGGKPLIGDAAKPKICADGAGCCDEVITACSGSTFVATSYDVELEVSGGTYSEECGPGCDLNGTYLLTWDSGISRYNYGTTLPQGDDCSVGGNGRNLYISLLPSCAGGVLALTNGHLSTEWDNPLPFLSVGDDDDHYLCLAAILASGMAWSDQTPTVGEWSTTASTTLRTPSHASVLCACLDGSGMQARARFL